MDKKLIREAEARMKTAVQALEQELATIRTGRASPALVENIQVEYYGVLTPLIQLATISTPDPRTLLISPFDPPTLKTIERAILASDLGLTPTNDGKTLRLILPPPTEERRRELVRIERARLEECRVAVRNVRRDVLNALRDLEHDKQISQDDLKRLEDDLQELTDRIVTEVDAVGERKEKEIMEV
jgi:ribosome recycling factor